MKMHTWKRWTAAAMALTLLLGPLAPGAQLADAVGSTVVNHALEGTATANEYEMDYWNADKAIDGIVNRDETDKPSQSRWSTKGAKTFEQVAQKEKILTVNLGAVKNFDQLVLEWQRTNVTQFRIEAAGASGNDWSTIYEKKDAGTTIPSETTTIDLGKTVSAQYVRLTVYGYTAGDNNWASVSLWEFQILEHTDGADATLDQVVAGLQMPTLTREDDTFPMPAVPQGFTIQLIGADYEQILDRDGTIYRPLVDTQVEVNFRVSKGDEVQETKAYTITVPGLVSQSSGNEKPVVIPELAEWSGGTGNFTLSDSTRVMVNPTYQEQLADVMAEFQKDYQDVTGKEITLVTGTQPQAHDFYFTLGSTDKGLKEEGYRMSVGESVSVEAVEAKGLYWSTRSILQILTQTGDTIPQGTARDYPLYEVRSFMLDLGRRPVSYAFLQSMVKEMAWYKLNDFHLHLNDNAFPAEYPNASEDVNVAKNAYSGFRLESDIKEGGNGGLNKANLTSEDMFYTKDQMRTLIQESRVVGVDIVPEIDAPAHSLALTKVRPDLIFAESPSGVDHLNLHQKYQETLKFVQSIFDEYISGDDPVFDQDTILHVGTDEYDAQYKEEFRQFTDDMLEYVQGTGRTVRLWGSLTQRPGDTPVRSENVQMNVWNTNWSNPIEMYQDGFDLINTEDFQLYIIPGLERTKPVGAYQEYLDCEFLYENWSPNIFKPGANQMVIPAGSDQMLGACFAVWYGKASGKYVNGVTEQDTYVRVADALPTMASKMWGDGEDLTYQELETAAAKIGTAPNDNPTYQATSVDDQYLSYTFEPGQEKEDSTANDRDITNLHHVSTQYGTLELMGQDSYVTTGLDKLGFGNALEFDVTLSEEAQPGQILFEADSEYGTHDIRILSDGTLGYTTELYDYSFGYKLPVGKTVHLRIESIRENSALIVDGVRYAATGSYAEPENGLSITNMGYPSFVLPLQRIGSETNAVVGYIDNVTVSVIPQVKKIVSVTADNEYADNPIENAFDGKTDTFWHSNWKPYQALPATVEINFQGPQTVTGFTYLPRQDNNNNGQVTKYDLKYKATSDGEWLPLVTDGTWTANNQKKTAADFEPVQAVALQFTAKEGTGDKNNSAYACAAEFEVLFGEPVEPLTMSAYATPAEGGSASVSPQEVTAGQSVTFTAQAEKGYQFDGWYDLLGNAVSDQTTYTVKADSSLTLIAKFSNEEVPHTHTLTKTEAKEPTCTEPGNKEYWQCETCGKYFSDEKGEHEIQLADTVVKATGHDLTKTEAKEPTCTEPGNKEYWQCETCGKYFSDEKGEHEIQLADAVVKATGHHYVDGECTVCGAKDPDYVEPTQKPEPSAQPTQEPQVTDKPETTQEPQVTDRPQATQQPDTVPPTGDASQLMVYVVAMGAAALLMGATVAVRKRRT